MGVALSQEFHTRNFSKQDPESMDWHFESVPDFAWIVTGVAGLLIFLYGFLGFWLCERKRKLWRINLHRIVFLLLS
jgi:hypothetical protein